MVIIMLVIVGNIECANMLLQIAWNSFSEIIGIRLNFSTFKQNLYRFLLD